MTTRTKEERLELKKKKRASRRFLKEIWQSLTAKERREYKNKRVQIDKQKSGKYPLKKFKMELDEKNKPKEG